MSRLRPLVLMSQRAKPTHRRKTDATRRWVGGWLTKVAHRLTPRPHCKLHPTTRAKRYRVRRPGVPEARWTRFNGKHKHYVCPICARGAA